MKAPRPSKEFDILFKDHPTPMWVINKNDYVIQRANKAALAIFHKKPGEVVATSFLSLFPENQKEIKSLIKSRAPKSASGKIFQFNQPKADPLAIKISSRNIEFSGIPSILMITENVTSARKAERLSSDFQAAIIGSSIVSRADIKGIITYVNDNFVQISGYSKSELIGKNHRIINSGHHPKAFWINMWKTISSGKTWRREVKNKTKTGDYYWVDTFIMPFMNEDGKVREYLSIRNDITERKRHEEEISGLIRLLSDVNFAINNASIVSRADKHGNITYINENFLKISGYNVSELIGKNHRIINSAYHPRTFWVNMWKTIASGKTWRAEVRNRAKDGSFYWVDTFIMPFLDEEGRVKEFLSIRNDISQRKFQEQQLIENARRFKQLYDQAPTMMHSVDAERRLTTVSDHWLATLGYSRREVIGRQVTDFLTTASKEYLTELLPRFEKTGTLENIEVEFVKKDGAVIDTLLTAISHFDSARNFIQSLAVITDITDRRRSEREIRRLALIARHTSNAVVITDEHGYIEWVNAGFTRITEYTLEEVIGKKPGSFLQGKETNTTTILQMREALRKGTGFKMEILNYSRSGRQYWLDIEVMPLHEHGKLSGFMAIELDITALKKSVEALQKGEETLRNLASNIPNGFLYQAHYNGGGRGFHFISDGVEKISGYPVSRFMENPLFIYSVFHPDDIYLLEKTQKEFESLEIFDEELRMVRPTGESRWVHIRSKIREINKNEYLRDGFAVDITERKLVELENIRYQRLLAVTSQINQMVLHATDVNGVYNEACRIAVEYGGFRMAWVGIPERGVVKPITVSALENNILKTVPAISILDIPEGQGPTGTAIRDRRTIVCNDFLQNDTDAKYWQAARQRNYRSGIALPVIIDNNAQAVFTLYSTEINFFAESEIRLLEKIVENIAFAIETIDTEEKRRQAEQLLAENEARQRQILGAMISGIIGINAEGKVTYANEKALELLSISKKQLLALDYLTGKFPWRKVDIAGNELPIERYPSLKALRKGKGVSDSEYGIILHNGTRKWIQESTISMKDSDGHFTGVLVLYSDITDRIESQKVIDVVNAIQSKFIEERNPEIYFNFALTSILQVTNSEYGLLAEVVQDGGEPAIRTYAFGNIAWDEGTRKQRSGQSRQEPEFNTLSNLLETVMKTSKPLISNNPSDDQRSDKSGNNTSLTSLLGLPILRGSTMLGLIGIANTSNDFTDSHIKMLAPIVSTIGGIIEALRTEQLNRYISEQLRQTTERLNLAINVSGLGVWYSDFKNKTYFGNERVKNIYGIENPVVPMEQFWQLVHPEDRASKRATDLAKFNSGENNFASEYRIVRPSDGTIRYIRAQGIYFKDQDGKIISGVSVIHDHTKDRQYEASLLNSLAEKEMLIKEIHHRVKNNLQLISSMLYLKMLAWSNPESKEFMTEMREKIKSVSLIHERLLQTESLNEIDIRDYLEKLLYDIQTSYFRHDLKLILKPEIDDISFSTDQATYLGQLTNELVINAIKHAFHGRAAGEISVSLHQQNESVTLEVKDNGTGLPLDADPSKPGSYGMQLIQVFVKQLRGQLHVIRENGTLFTIEFKK